MTSPLPSTIAHLDALTATGAEGWLVISTPVDGKWQAWSFPTDQVDAAAQRAADLDAKGLNVYVRTNLLGRPLSRRSERGLAADTGAVVALTADLDIAGPGHKHGKTDHPLPKTIEAAMTIVADLPQPSMTTRTSDTGRHCWWLLDEPVTDEPMVLLEKWAARLVAAGAAKGLHVDRPDPARVLRVCGTHRRKKDSDGNTIPPSLVTMHDVAGWPADGLGTRPWCPTARYGAQDLLEALPKPPPPTPPPPPVRPRRPGEVGPADAVSRLAWADILEPLEWTYEGTGEIDGNLVELWRRPGASSDHSLKCFPEGPAVAWSDACGLPVGGGQRLNKWRVYFHLHHGGDEKAAARAIRLRAWEMAR